MLFLKSRPHMPYSKSVKSLTVILNGNCVNSFNAPAKTWIESFLN